MPQQYLVVHRLHFTSPELASECTVTLGELNISPESDMSIYPDLERHFTGSQNDRFASCEVQALDPFSASRAGWMTMSKALDTMQFAQPSLDVHISSSFVLRPGGGLQVVPTSLELLGPIRIARQEISRIADKLRVISRRMDSVTLSRLGLGLQYLRRGLTDSAPHGQFLNYWIGLEAIATGKHRTEIPTMRSYVPRIITLGYPRRVIRDLWENMSRLRLDADPILRSIPVESAGPFRKLEALWRGICTPSIRVQLVGLASTSPLLQHRINSVADAMGNCGSIQKSMAAHERELSWHLQRMFRTRNSIVHGGYVPQDLTHIASHLATYLWVILRSMLDEFASDAGTDDMQKFFDKHLQLYEMMYRKLEDSSNGGPPFSILLEPTSMWP